MIHYNREHLFFPFFYQQSRGWKEISGDEKGEVHIDETARR